MPMDMLAVGGIFGGLSLAQGIFGGLSANSQDQARQIQAQLQAQNANFQRQWQVESSNRNIDKRNLARAIGNKKLEQTALNERAIAEIYSKLGYDNAKSQYSKQTNQINSALLSSISGRNISMSSGTARALLRQNLQNATVNMANLRVSQMNKMRDIETSYQNRLAQRDFNFEEHNIYLPGDTSSVSGGSMVNIIGGAALGGISAGLSGALMYGADSPVRG